MSSIGDVFLRLLLDDSDFEQQVVAKAQKAGNKAGLSMGQQFTAGMAKGAAQLGQSLAGIGQNLTKAGSAMTRNLTLPILAAGAATANFALDFDTTLRRVVGLTDVTADEIGGIRDQILALGPAVGKGPQELAEAFYFVASAGFKAQEAMDVLKVAAESSASGLGDTQTIAQVLGAVINAYGKENITAARAADILTEAVSQGTAEADAFAGVVGRVVPVAASLGVSFDQVAAALAGMTLSGISADEAATSLRQIMVSLLKPSNEANDALAAMGLSAEGLRAELREKGLLATLRTLEAAFAGNESATAAVFGNVRALVGIQNLLGLSSEQLDQVFGKVNDSLGRQAEAYKDTEGPQRDMARSMADLQATAITLGNDVLPTAVEVLGQIAAGAKEVAKWWKSLDADTRKQIVQWLAWVAVAGPVLLLAGKLASGLGAIFKVIGFLLGSKGIPALVGSMSKARLGMLGWVGVILAVTAALDAATPAVSDFFDTLVSGKKANKVLHDLNDLTGDMLKAQVLRAWGVSAKQFVTVLERAGGDVEDAFNAIKDNAGDVGKAMEQLAVDSDTAFHGMVSGFGRNLKEARAAVRSEGEGIPHDLAATLVDGQFVVGPAAVVMVDPIAEAVEKAKQDVADAANDLLHTLASILSSHPQELRDAAQSMIDDILHPFPDAKHILTIESILARKEWVTGLTSPDSGDRARTAEYLKGLLTEFETLAPGVLESGKDIPPALQAGIDSTLAALTTYLQTTVIGGITDPFDLADELDRMGYDGLAGYVRGLERARIDKLQTTGGLILRDTKIALFDDYYQEGYDAATSYAQGLAAGGKTAVTYVQDFTGKIASLLRFSGSPDYTHSREAGEGVGKSWMQSLASSIASLLPTISQAVGKVAGTLMAQPMGLATAGVPSMAGVASAGVQATSGSSTVNNTWNLTVNGVPYTFKSRDDFIKALDAVGRFGGSDGRLPGG